jgi:hypothetical protein
MQVCNPSAIAKDKYISFFLKARRLGSLEHFPFVEDLEGINPISLAHFDHTDLAKGSTTNNLEDFKVILAQPEFFYSIGHRFH